MGDAIWFLIIAASVLVLWLGWPSVRADLKRRETMTEDELKDDGWHHR